MTEPRAKYPPPYLAPLILLVEAAIALGLWVFRADIFPVHADLLGAFGCAVVLGGGVVVFYVLKGLDKSNRR